jgi:hypothetical protein
MHGAGHGIWALLGLVLLAAPTAKAADPEPPPSEGPRAQGEVREPVDAMIEIERAPGAEACPDAAAVFGAIARLFPERPFRQTADVSTSAASAHITIRPRSPGYEAVVTVLRPRRGERVISEKDENCRGLADALALAFVMLVEPPDSTATAGGGTEATGAAELSTSTPSAAPLPPNSAQKTSAPEPTTPAHTNGTGATEPARKHALYAELGASGVGGLGLLSEPALGAAAALELVHTSGWGVSLHGVRLWSPPADAQDGSVTLTVWALLVGPCYRGRLSTKSSLDGCLLYGVGSQHADVKGFQDTVSGPFPWMVLVPTFGYRLDFTRALGGFVRVGPVFQLLPQSFSVRVDEGTDTAQVAAAPKLGVMAELGLTFGGDLFLMRFGDRG